MIHRRMMMREELIEEDWDYILTPAENGAVVGYPINATAGQKIKVAWAPCAQGKYVWRTQTSGALQPSTSGQSSNASGAIVSVDGGEITIEVLSDCEIVFGNRTSGSTSAYYGFNGDWIKIKLL